MTRIDYDVAPTNGSVRRVVNAIWGNGDHREHIDVDDAVERRKFFGRLADKVGMDPAELVKRDDNVLVLAADDADRNVDDEVDEAGRPPDESKQSLATKLVRLASDAAEFWRTPDGDAFATVEVDGHQEHYRIRSRAFRQWLARRCYLEMERTPGSQAVADATNVIEGQATYDGDEHAAPVRLAEHDGKVYIDLCNPDWHAVEIDATGWRIVVNPPVRFRRAKAMLPLPVPVPGGTVESLRKFVNVSDEDWHLVVAWLVAAMRPQGPYPVLALFAEQGSGKSTAARLLRSLVDPNTAPLRSEPREARDLMIAANNGWTVAVDNLSRVPDWFSDALCRLSTGGGFSTRTLFENDEETIFDAKRPVLLTAIDDVVSRADLLDRTLVVKLPTIPEKSRQTEAQMLVDFERARPHILGGLLDVLSAGLRNLPSTTLDHLPRMADFARWVTACEPALGWSAGSFSKTYTNNRDDANSLALDAEPVVPLIRQLVDNKLAWSGTATELLTALKDLAGYGTGKDQERPPKWWPANAKSLAGTLKRLAPNLRAAGIEVCDWREPDRRRRRMWSLTVLERRGDSASDSSDASDTPENQGDRRTQDLDFGRTDPIVGRTVGRTEAGNGRTPDDADAPDAPMRLRSYSSPTPDEEQPVDDF